MFALRRQLQAPTIQRAIASQTSGLAARKFGYAQSVRLQSTINHDEATNTGVSTINEELSDQEVDSWLETIESLRAEFTEQQYMPETSLAGPGQTKINLLEEALNAKKTFEPSEEQVAEWEALKSVPLPLRKDETVQHVTNMIMRHGKKQRAEKTLSRALYLVYCNTRQDPVQVLKKALDDLAPLMVVKTFKTGVAKAAVIPVPLNSRQRNRTAWKWVSEGANKRSSSELSVRIAEELISVFKGNSSGFDKRDQMHKTAIAHRAYIKLK
ncbi:LANO_0B03884g1_1 [Lachancea nothofagi CBS 11611]|uniref:Small ribosomal subunit protein uS7m n=1 Tax=Lachancea nothofagi CBS 11611 TaxID=1266666 RepID=A0A1G4IXR1_9SACH|nr:LANO_0B03884g1_1 [Lachancea nothofagi CBS 11611]